MVIGRFHELGITIHGTWLFPDNKFSHFSDWWISLSPINSRCFLSCGKVLHFLSPLPGHSIPISSVYFWTNMLQYYSGCCCLVTKLCLALCNPMDCSPPGPSVHGIDFPGKNTGVSCHFLLQGIFQTQGLNPHLLHWKVDSLPLCHLGSPSVI